MKSKPLPLRTAARWAVAMHSLPALSVRQPFAWMIVHGFKEVENRSRRINYRGPLLIHASLKLDTLYDEDVAIIERQTGAQMPENLTTDDARVGGIVGIAEVVDCVRDSTSPWKNPDSWGWVLANARPLPFRECKGAVGIFYPKLQ
jgi:hypothetical protein